MKPFNELSKNIIIKRRIAVISRRPAMFWKAYISLLITTTLCAGLNMLTPARLRFMNHLIYLEKYDLKARRRPRLRNLERRKNRRMKIFSQPNLNPLPHLIYIFNSRSCSQILSTNSGILYTLREWCHRCLGMIIHILFTALSLPPYPLLYHRILHFLSRPRILHLLLILSALTVTLLSA